MPLKNLPTRAQIIDRLRVDVKSELPASDPYNQSGIINAELVALGSRISELYEQTKIIAVNNFVTTMTDDDSIITAGNELGLTLNPATESTGNIIFTGTPASSVPQGSELTSEGNTYITQSSATISTQVINISSLSRSGNIAIVDTVNGHNLGSGMTVTIAGANETEYNGAFVITVVDADSFTYEVTGLPATPATGTITVSSDSALVSIQSLETGQSQNLIAGSQLNLSATISGIDSVAYTDYLGIDGGTDQETIEEFRERIVFNKQNPVTNFNKVQIIEEAKKITGVTRVFVYSPDDLVKQYTSVTLTAEASKIVTIDFGTAHGLFDGAIVTITGANEPDYNGTFTTLKLDANKICYLVDGISNGTATGSPQVDTEVFEKGQVGIYFVRDNDTNIIPSGAEITEVKNQILTIKPADIDGVNDVLVLAPTLKSQSFTLSNLNPDTQGIRDSIETNLKQLFTDTGLGENISESQYTSAIQFAFDNETGVQLKTFTNSVSGELTADYFEILGLGTINYS